ncbi:ATP-dependent helicase [Flavipsychrobacter stenotrophus]|uniref:DNA 3'-5' helicase II n=1 Tax=Flavipsychrobacter stenotrophus TaxID=2077091 RepID=A0A2S7SQN7_9BACT|nr:UvrD-helicase domain-containing protein [Flavipsychrobacter stenotrophus]PQJ08915.1 ATP-dependent helicase [Flavipsychrobacter stenotrophus]
MAEKLGVIEEIFYHVSKGENFLLSGGAGSGKTYSLVQVLKRIFELNPKANVACITYTNVAVKEINSRVRFENLRVSTIHDFLWDNIKTFQKNLKESLVELISSEKIVDSSGEDINLNYLKNKAVEYKEWRKVKDGIISHDEVIALSEYMFATYPLLSDILKDKYQYILIDEYQDTAAEVIRILLDYLQKSKKKNIIGFFGDSMQSIYDGTVGNIVSYVNSGVVKEVLKEDNRRNPKVVIDLANKLRIDKIRQKPADDENAMNYNKNGSIKFLYSDNADFTAIKETEYFNGWNFKDSKETKELYLTHNLIAPKAGFLELMAIYDRDPILGLKSEIIARIKRDNLAIDETQSFDAIVDLVPLRNRQRELKKDVILRNYPDLYNELKDLPFEKVRRLYLDKDQLIGNKKGTEEEERKKGSKRDGLIKHLFHIQECIFLYEQSKYNEFIRANGYKVTSIQDKIDLREAINVLKGMKDRSIEDVIDFADSSKIWPKSDSLFEFLEEKEYVFNRVKKVKYQEFCNLHDYVEGYTPFSTQHNIKGSEFDNVFVVLDNGRWNDYNFEYLFLDQGTQSVLERTQKIFYVCCTRAKEKLIVFYHDPKSEVIQKAKDLFGHGNVFKI